MIEKDERGFLAEAVYAKEAEYPFGYFEAQVYFAAKWSKISGEPLTETLLTKTALYTKITDVKPPIADELWQATMDEIVGITDLSAITEILYTKYLQQPHHVYEPPSHPEDDGRHFGYFGFDHFPPNAETGEKDRIKIHFITHHRGEQSSLDPQYLLQRQADLKRMFNYIRHTFPQAEEVVGGSWLYGLQSYRDSFPVTFTENMKRLVPRGFGHLPESVPHMSFGGDSVWGQFVDKRGGVRQPTHDQFLNNIEAAKSLEDLVNAFPNYTWQPRVPITVFYDWLSS